MYSRHQKILVNVHRFTVHANTSFSLLLASIPSDIDTKFKEQLKNLAPLLLSPEKLVVKRLGDTPAIGRTLLQCFIVSSHYLFIERYYDYMHVLVHVLRKLEYSGTYCRLMPRLLSGYEVLMISAS